MVRTYFGPSYAHLKINKCIKNHSYHCYRTAAPLSPNQRAAGTVNNSGGENSFMYTNGEATSGGEATIKWRRGTIIKCRRGCKWRGGYRGKDTAESPQFIYKRT